MTDNRDYRLLVPTPEQKTKILGYIGKNGSDLSFTKSFWKECEPNRPELTQYSKYVDVLSRFSRGERIKEIADATGVLDWSVRTWTTFKQRPKLAHYLQAFIERGAPRSGWVWLSVNNTPGHAIPQGPIVQVPRQIGSWAEVQRVLASLQPLQPTPSQFTKPYLFGFLLGIAIGDASKKRQENWHRHFELVLSGRYPESERIGDFTCDCARSIGLRMKSMPRLKPPNKPHEFFVWVSQSSALIDWVFNVCLGLKDDELTTYNPVRMDWALEGPVDFRRGLIQGLAESDGSVNVSGQEVEFWIGPSWDFVRALLKTFGINSFRSRLALAISKNEVTKALRVPIFAPHLQTVRYQRFVKLANAKHIPRGVRLPLEIRREIADLARSGVSIPSISESILDKFGIIPTYETTQRWAEKVPERERG